MRETVESGRGKALAKNSSGKLHLRAVRSDGWSEAQGNLYAKLKTLEQSCGSYELVSPKAERAAIEKAWTAAQPYVACVQRYQQDAPPFPGYFGSHIRVVGEHVRGFAPFLCSKWKQAGCIDDAAWQTLATVATPANVGIAKAGDTLWDTGKREVEFFAMQFERWAEDLNSKAVSIGMK